METAARKPKIHVLQAGRALAAFGVLVNHANLSVSARVGEMSDSVNYVLSATTYRIDFFFVLSGFIIYLITYGKALCGLGDAYRFVRKRCVRIYPVYWILTLIFVLRLLNDPSFSFSDKAWHWFPTITLLPYTERPALGVAWTLQHEIIFYGVFALGIFIKRLHWIMIGWAIMLLAILLSGAAIPKPYSFVTSAYNLQFCIGMLTAYMYLTRPAAAKWVYLLLAAAFMIGFYLIGHRLLMGLCFAPLILLLIQMEREGRFTVPRWLVTLGDSSFTLYLSHAIMVHLFSRSAALMTDNPYLAMLGVCLGCYVFALIFYAAIEKPLIRWSKA